MEYIELSSNVDQLLYPDIAEAGGLAGALRNELRRLDCQLDVTFLPDFIPNGYVKLGPRSCQIFMAAHERLFSVGFWRQGLEYGKGTTQSLPELASAIVHWLQDQPTTAAMEERIRWFGSTEIGRAHEAGRIVDYQWQALMEQWQRHEETLAEPARSPLPLIEAAQHRPELRKLVPFTSMFELCFSRSTDSVFDRDCPSVEALVDGGYRVYSERFERRKSRFGGADFTVYEILGEVSTLDEALDLLVAHLPREEGGGERD